MGSLAFLVTSVGLVLVLISGANFQTLPTAIKTTDSSVEGNKDAGSSETPGPKWPPVFWRPPSEANTDCDKADEKNTDTLAQMITSLLGGKATDGDINGQSCGNTQNQDNLDSKYIIDSIKKNVEQKNEENEQLANIFSEVTNTFLAGMVNVNVKEIELRDVIEMVMVALTTQGEQDRQEFMFMRDKLFLYLSSGVGMTNETTSRAFISAIMILSVSEDQSHDLLMRYNKFIIEYFGNELAMPLSMTDNKGNLLTFALKLLTGASEGINSSSAGAVAERVVNALTDKHDPTRKLLTNMTAMLFNAFGIRLVNSSQFWDMFQEILMNLPRQDAIRYFQNEFEMCGGLKSMLKQLATEAIGILATTADWNSNMNNGQYVTGQRSCDVAPIIGTLIGHSANWSPDLKEKVGKIFKYISDMLEGKNDDRHQGLKCTAFQTVFDAFMFGNVSNKRNVSKNGAKPYKAVAESIVTAVGMETSMERLMLARVINKVLGDFGFANTNASVLLNTFRDEWDGMSWDQIVEYNRELFETCGGLQNALSSALMTAGYLLTNDSVMFTPTNNKCNSSLFAQKIAFPILSRGSIDKRVTDVLLNVTDALQGKGSNDSSLDVALSYFIARFSNVSDVKVDIDELNGDEPVKFVLQSFIQATLGGITPTRYLIISLVNIFFTDLGFENLTMAKTLALDNILMEAIQRISYPHLLSEDVFIEMFYNFTKSCGGVANAVVATANEMTAAILGVSQNGTGSENEISCSQFAKTIGVKLLALVNEINAKLGWNISQRDLLNFADLLSERVWEKDLEGPSRGSRIISMLKLFSESDNPFKLVAYVLKTIDDNDYEFAFAVANLLNLLSTSNPDTDQAYKALYHILEVTKARMPDFQKRFMSSSLVMWHSDHYLQYVEIFMRIARNKKDPRYEALLHLIKALDGQDAAFLWYISALGIDARTRPIFDKLFRILEVIFDKGDTMRGSVLKQSLMLIAQLPGDQSEITRQIVDALLGEDEGYQYNVGDVESNVGGGTGTGSYAAGTVSNVGDTVSNAGGTVSNAGGTGSNAGGTASNAGGTVSNGGDAGSNNVRVPEANYPVQEDVYTTHSYRPASVNTCRPTGNRDFLVDVLTKIVFGATGKK